MSINFNMTNLVVYLTHFVHFNIKKFFAHAETYKHTKCPFSIQTILWLWLKSKLPPFCSLFQFLFSLLYLHFHHLITRAEFKFYKTAQLNSRRCDSKGSCCKYRATNTSPNLNCFFFFSSFASSLQQTTQIIECDCGCIFLLLLKLLCEYMRFKR